jgi:hypothetical protein
MPHVSLHLKYSHPCSPTIILRINYNLVGERICFAGGYWRNVILLPVYSRYNLHSSLQQHSLHSFPNLSSLCSEISASHLTQQHEHIPLSVLGVASVTSSVHCSQHISSSPFINQALRRFFSKNWTAIKPLTPVFLAPRSELVSNCLTSVAVL